VLAHGHVNSSIGKGLVVWRACAHQGEILFHGDAQWL